VDCIHRALPSDNNGVKSLQIPLFFSTRRCVGRLYIISCNRACIIFAKQRSGGNWPATFPEKNTSFTVWAEPSLPISLCLYSTDTPLSRCQFTARKGTCSAFSTLYGVLQGPGIAKYRLNADLWASSSELPDDASSPRNLILTVWLCGSTSGLLVTREQRGNVELVWISKGCIGDLESTEEAFCCPDFRVTTWALCAGARSARFC